MTNWPNYDAALRQRASLTVRVSEAAVAAWRAELRSTAEIAPTQRDRHLQLIAGHGRVSWQKMPGYNDRALVEADIDRNKRVIGDALRSRTNARRNTEVGVAVYAPNKILALRRPGYVRVA